jgi:hypothetical protein
LKTEINYKRILQAFQLKKMAGHAKTIIVQEVCDFMENKWNAFHGKTGGNPALLRAQMILKDLSRWATNDSDIDHSMCQLARRLIGVLNHLDPAFPDAKYACRSILESVVIRDEPENNRVHIPLSSEATEYTTKLRVMQVVGDKICILNQNAMVELASTMRAIRSDLIKVQGGRSPMPRNLEDYWLDLIYHTSLLSDMQDPIALECSRMIGGILGCSIFNEYVEAFKADMARRKAINADGARRV